MILRLMLISILALPAIGFPKGGGNGGKVVSCPWRNPIVLDYYELFMGNLNVEPLSNSITPIKLNLATITEENFSRIFLDLLNETIAYHNKAVKMDTNVNQANKDNQKNIKEILKNFKENFQEISLYFPKINEWNLGQNNVYTTDDSGEKYNLPAHCSLKQIANYRFQDGKFGIYANEKVVSRCREMIKPFVDRTLHVS